MFEDDPNAPIYSKHDIILMVLFGIMFALILLGSYFSYEIYAFLTS
jgi:hypothetical protein